MSRPIKLIFGSAQTTSAPAPFAVEPAAYAPKGAIMCELAYGKIKRRIMACEFRPGESLSETQLGVLLGLGRTPIHQVLHRLEMEGLAQILPHKGVLVTPLSLNDALDMIETCATNEILYVTLAAGRVHSVGLDAMCATVNVSPAPIEHRSITASATLDLKFHLTTFATSCNRVLAESLRGLHEKQARFWFLPLSELQHLQNVYDEYLAVLDALERRDVLAAREAIHEHTDEFRRMIIRML